MFIHHPRHAGTHACRDTHTRANTTARVSAHRPLQHCRTLDWLYLTCHSSGTAGACFAGCCPTSPSNHPGFWFSCPAGSCPAHVRACQRRRARAASACPAQHCGGAAGLRAAGGRAGDAAHRARQGSEPAVKATPALRLSMRAAHALTSAPLPLLLSALPMASAGTTPPAACRRACYLKRSSAQLSRRSLVLGTPIIKTQQFAPVDSKRKMAEQGVQDGEGGLTLIQLPEELQFAAVRFLGAPLPAHTRKPLRCAGWRPRVQLVEAPRLLAPTRRVFCRAKCRGGGP